MGRVVLIFGITLTLTIAVALGVTVQLDRAGDVEPLAALDRSVSARGGAKENMEISQPVQVGSTGSALATAAFGLSALQPETFNSQIVRDIIEASPLAYGEKDRLTAKLAAAEAGRGELPRVLADIRVSLAVE
ncbi:MAG: hypothetical protein AAF718_14480 [Pseudomonadota bacterium]